MSILGLIRRPYISWAVPRLQKKILLQSGPKQFNRSDWERSLRDPTGFYLDCFRFFHQSLPEEVREHRFYFRANQRGFGEDALHVMWFLLFQEFKPQNFLEIGVFRGQTLSLAALLSRMNGINCAVQGISPFTSAGDSVSEYQKNLDYQTDTLANFTHFSLPRPELLKAFSTDATATSLIQSKTWDLIYIDGNHDYEIARADWEVCSNNLRTGGVIVLDDSGLTSAYRPSLFATGGHPGPSRLAQEIDRRQFVEILQVGHNRVFQKIS